LNSCNEEDKNEIGELPVVPVGGSMDEEDREDIPELTKQAAFDQISDFDGIEVHL